MNITNYKFKDLRKPKNPVIDFDMEYAYNKHYLVVVNKKDLTPEMKQFLEDEIGFAYYVFNIFGNSHFAMEVASDYEAGLIVNEFKDKFKL